MSYELELDSKFIKSLARKIQLLILFTTAGLCAAVPELSGLDYGFSTAVAATHPSRVSRVMPGRSDGDKMAEALAREVEFSWHMISIRSEEMASRQDFEKSFELIIGHEGVFSNDSRDRGNWDSGVIGKGNLKGTKYGIAAHVYPDLDIKNLTLGDAHEIYFRDYWSKAGCADMPSRLQHIVFDAAVNNGVGAAVKWLQQAVGAPADGVFGPNTRGHLAHALSRQGESTVLFEVHAHRLRMMVELPTWKTFRGGWSRRLVKVPYEASDNWPRQPGGET